ncbi:MAG: hypothetical protein HF978_14215 [Desulfobacteraceae bacterium]|nr:hypothetical protein [Desulfobacteraceae bacterium]MBC2756693.1 hypothetical protein [Desulfobacteraceae bacterium]
MAKNHRKVIPLTKEERKCLEEMNFYGDEKLKRAINQAIKNGINVVEWLTAMCKLKGAGSTR